MAHVVRMWKGYGSDSGVRRYCEQHFPNSVLPELQRLAGFIGARLLVRQNGRHTELVVATEWQSLDAIRAFTGDDLERAVVEPEVRELLDRFEDRVSHYAVNASYSEGGPAREA